LAWKSDFFFEANQQNFYLRPFLPSIASPLRLQRLRAFHFGQGYFEKVHFIGSRKKQ
jgi:hypothetical protein